MKNKTNEKEITNLSEYTYPPNSTVNIPSDLFTALLDTLNIIEQNGTIRTMLNSVPKALGKDKLEYQMHDSKSFFSQEPTVALTIEAAMALDMKFNLLQILQRDVIEGIAVKNIEVRE